MYPVPSVRVFSDEARFDQVRSGFNNNGTNILLNWCIVWYGLHLAKYVPCLIHLLSFELMAIVHYEDETNFIWIKLYCFNLRWSLPNVINLSTPGMWTFLSTVSNSYLVHTHFMLFLYLSITSKINICYIATIQQTSQHTVLRINDQSKMDMNIISTVRAIQHYLNYMT